MCNMLLIGLRAFPGVNEKRRRETLVRIRFIQNGKERVQGGQEPRPGDAEAVAG